MDQTRRQFLKILASAPLILPFGLTASPIMRYLKPTMKPGGFFDLADMPGSEEEIAFSRSDFPVPWTCIPFMYHMKITEFNPEKQEIREIPAFMIRLADEEIVAYSRICPRGSCILNWVPNPGEFNCGCATTADKCCCHYKLNTPALVCPCDLSTFDLSRAGKVVFGPASRPPRKFDLTVREDMIIVGALEMHVIQ